ncbi:hypothetical protein GDO86_007963 [Hymenochirus boettgeri]|uniref:Uncharacterized protein n=1 Tax=Hymenochirus boettgeri TaxID=247094 RepID=A0A8T2J190_9PIPI|nr:hypothetical protein GDO86_007963 [Hymenochirus boettgeri]
MSAVAIKLLLDRILTSMGRYWVVLNCCLVSIYSMGAQPRPRCGRPSGSPCSNCIALPPIRPSPVRNATTLCASTGWASPTCAVEAIYAAKLFHHQTFPITKIYKYSPITSKQKMLMKRLHSVAFSHLTGTLCWPEILFLFYI